MSSSERTGLRREREGRVVCFSAQVGKQNWEATFGWKQATDRQWRDGKRSCLVDGGHPTYPSPSVHPSKTWSFGKPVTSRPRPRRPFCQSLPNHRVPVPQTAFSVVLPSSRSSDLSAPNSNRLALASKRRSAWHRLVDLAEEGLDRTFRRCPRPIDVPRSQLRPSSLASSPRPSRDLACFSPFPFPWTL